MQIDRLTRYILAVSRVEALHVIDAVNTLAVEEENLIFKSMDAMVAHPLADSNTDVTAERSPAADNAGMKIKERHYNE